jgi:hypothetical protein
VAQARDPVTPNDEPDAFQLIAATTTSSDTVVINHQNMVTGEPIEAPLPTIVRLGLIKPPKV